MRSEEGVGRAGRLGGVEVVVASKLAAAADHCNPFFISAAHRDQL